MRRVVSVLAATAALLVLVTAAATGPTAAGAVVDPAVEAMLAAAAPDEMVDVLVVLKAQEDLSKIKEAKRSARLAAVVRALHARSNASQKGLRAFLKAGKADGNVRKIVPLWVLDAIEVEATPSLIRGLARRTEVREIRPNVQIQAPAGAATGAAPELNLDRVNAEELWSLGFRGGGVVVANMDTGVDASHPDLAGRWRGGTNSWYDPNGQHPTTPTDVDGHGTWTMGVMVGGDAGGSSIGVAPDAKWIAVKIFNDRGIATTAGVHLGFQWLLDPDGDPSTPDAPNVVNNSWTMGTFSCNLEFELDLQSLRAAGIVPVFAAGNFGPGASTVASPANNPEALSVGAVDDSEVVDPSSGRGPSACDQAVAPDLVAPGVGIRTTDLWGFYTSASGTSLAAPHVAGALALLLSAFPNLTADRQEAALLSGATDLGAAGPDNAFGQGRLDARASYNSLASSPDFAVSATPSTVTTPAGGAASYDVSVAGVNGFTGDVTLDLQGPITTQAVWSFSPAVVTGGSGSSRLDVTTAADIAPGSYQLTINAASGSTSRTTTVTVVIPTPPDFLITATPSSASVVVGSTASYQVGVGSLNGFAGDVALSLAGLSPAVASWTFSPASVNTAGSSELTVTTTGTAAPGTYPFTITGSSGSSTHGASATLVVTPPPDFGLTAMPSSQNVVAGQTATYSVQVSSLNGFGGNVTLSLSGLPTSVGSSTFTPAAVSGAGTSRLTISTPSGAAPGTYSLTITGTSGSIVHSAGASLILTPAPDFSLSVSPGSRTIYRGQSAAYTITVSALNGFAGSVSLSVSSLPAGAQKTFSRNPVTAPGTSTLTVRTFGTTPRGTFTLKINGKSGVLSHQVTAVLIVR